MEEIVGAIISVYSQIPKMLHVDVRIAILYSLPPPIQEFTNLR
jgi:hypothetical protein